MKSPAETAIHLVGQPEWARNRRYPLGRNEPRDGSLVLLRRRRLPSDIRFRRKKNRQATGRKCVQVVDCGELPSSGSRVAFWWSPVCRPVVSHLQRTSAKTGGAIHHENQCPKWPARTGVYAQGERHALWNRAPFPVGPSPNATEGWGDCLEGLGSGESSRRGGISKVPGFDLAHAPLKPMHFSGVRAGTFTVRNSIRRGID